MMKHEYTKESFINNYHFLSFQGDFPSNLAPVSLVGWRTLYYADIPFGDNVSQYRLIIAYNKNLSQDEFISALSSSQGADKPVVVVFHIELLDTIIKILKDNFDVIMRKYRVTHEWNSILSHLDVSPASLTKMLVNFENSSRISNSDVQTINYYPIGDLPMDDIERDILSAWGEPIKKRILTFVMLSSKGIGLDELGEKVTTRYDINGSVAELVGLEILAEEAGTVTPLKRTMEILAQAMSDEFGTSPEMLLKRLSDISQITSAHSVAESLKNQIKTLVGEEPMLPKKRSEDYKQQFVFKESRIVVLELRAEDRGNKNLPSQARDFAEGQFGEEARYICLLTAPKFDPDLVKYTADWLKRRITLVDSVSLLISEAAIKEIKKPLEVSRRRKILDVFVNNNAAALWDVRRGLKVIS